MIKNLLKIKDYFFKELNYDIIEATIPSLNIASKNLAEKIGMTLEATLKNRYIDKENNIQDLLVYSIFNKEKK